MEMMGVVPIIILLVFILLSSPSSSAADDSKSRNRVSINVEGGPESVVWIVQLSDLHFSVHHPKRALDFMANVGPTLSLINPSLVLITGDLTDAKSKDMVESRQYEAEWIEYKNVMEHVIQKSGLNKNIFYDIRGNHDNYGVPHVGGSFDYFPKYSINGQLGRTGSVNSVTLQIGERKHLFVGFDSTPSVGLRAPTNIFGHPTDQLLSELDSELSEWDFQLMEPVTKISFGHFPLSFSANTESGKSLKDIFLKHSVSAYICGHLHRSFGENLKRYHQLDPHSSFSKGLFQLNPLQRPPRTLESCSNGSLPINEFWEWEMGDWRSSRSIRILAVDNGHVSFADMDLQLGAKETIILPTFPLDSRFMLSASSSHKYKCDFFDPSSYGTIRALVFSVVAVTSVVAKIHDSRAGAFELVMEASMRKVNDNSSRGDLYIAPWNFKAFDDPSPDRFWLQIEVIDLMGKTSLTKPRPFSVSGISSKFSWTWKEFKVMGCQWGALYYPIFWTTFMCMVCAALALQVRRTFFKKQCRNMNVIGNRRTVHITVWSLKQLLRDSLLWFGVLSYLFYLIVFPWFNGRVFTSEDKRAYMTYRGWIMESTGRDKNIEFVGFPDIMVVVIPHILLVVLPAIISIGALAYEADCHQACMVSSSTKKNDDHKENDEENRISDRRGKFWIRKLLVLVCLAIVSLHSMKCGALMKAYQMNPLLDFPVYCFAIPLLLAYAVYVTRRT